MSKPTLAIFMFFAMLMNVEIKAEDQDKNKDQETSMTERPARQSSRDVMVPESLVTLIEKSYRTYFDSLKLAPQTRIDRKLLNVTVELTQHRPVALHEDVRILTPLGGGVIDLEDFVTPLRGSFHVKIRVSKNRDVELENLRVFFISRAKTRQIEGEDYGGGCEKYMEVTSHFQRAMSGDGYELYTAEQRYVSVLGGTFILVSFDREALHVGGVTFTDGRHSNLLCEAK